MFFKTLCLYTDIYTNKGYQYIIRVLIHVLNISGSHGALQLCEQIVDNSKVESKESFTSYNFSLGFFYLCSMEATQCKGPLMKGLCNLDEYS